MSDDIDPNQVQWDQPIDVSAIKWDAKPSVNAAPPLSPTEGMSNTELALAGAGKAPFDIWRGVKQLVHNPLPFVTIGSDPQEEIDESAKLDRPLMQTPAGLAGNVAGNVGTYVAGGGLAAEGAGIAGLSRTARALGGIANPTSFSGAAGSGALQGALAPTETGGSSRLFNAGAGAVLGEGGMGVSRVASNVLEPVTQAASKAVQALTNAGVPLDAAQRSGSILLQRAKAMLSDNPLTAGAQADFQDMQKRAFTKAVLTTIGEKGHAATPDVMGGAMTRMGNTYDDIATRVGIPYDHIEPALADIENQARLTLNDSQFGVVQRNLNDIVQKASANGGVIDGPQFSNLKKTMDALSGGADSDVGEVARDIRQTLHQGLLDSATASGNKADVQTLKTTNQQWGNMRKIEGAIAKDGSGEISPSKLANVMYQKANRYQSIYGKGDTSLVDLANAGNELLPNKTPNSGTPSRILAQAVLPVLGAGVGYGEGKDWKSVAGGAALGYGLPKAIQMGLNSQGAFGRLAKSAASAIKESPSSAVVLPGIAQHVPATTLLSSEAGLDKSKKELENQQ